MHNYIIIQIKGIYLDVKLIGYKVDIKMIAVEQFTGGFCGYSLAILQPF